MKSKSLLIAVAAFAVTATGAQAFGSPTVLNRAQISSVQRQALEEAHELRQSGDREAARDRLVEAGIDEEVIHSLREAAREVKTEIRGVVAEGDYNKFKELIEDAPLADIITSEADFELFREAHELSQSGDKEGAQAIFENLGLERGPLHGPSRHKGKHQGAPSQLTDEQREAVRVAKESNDKETVRAILEQAGVGRF